MNPYLAFFLGVIAGVLLVLAFYFANLAIALGNGYPRDMEPMRDVDDDSYDGAGCA